MSLKNICTIEALLRGGTRAGAEAAHHRALVMGQSVSVLVVLSRKAFVMVLTSDDGALLGSLGLMGQQVSFEILEDLATIRMRASTLFGTFFTRL